MPVIARCRYCRKCDVCNEIIYVIWIAVNVSSFITVLNFEASRKVLLLFLEVFRSTTVVTLNI